MLKNKSIEPKENVDQQKMTKFNTAELLHLLKLHQSLTM